MRGERGEVEGQAVLGTTHPCRHGSIFLVRINGSNLKCVLRRCPRCSSLPLKKMSEAADSSTAAVAVTPAKPRVVIHKCELQFLRELLAKFRVAVATDDAAVVAAQVDSREGALSLSHSASSPPPVLLTFSVKGAYDYILPLYLNKFPDRTRALSTCNLIRVNDLIKEKPPPPSASASSNQVIPPGGILVGGVQQSGSAAPPVAPLVLNAKEARKLRLQQALEEDASALATDCADASSLLSSLKIFGSRELSVIREGESDGIRGDYERASGVAKRLEDRSTKAASAASLPLTVAMSDALRKAVNCGWEWALGRDAADREYASLPFNAVTLIPDSDASSLKKKALESDPHREDREALSGRVTASRRSEELFFVSACRKLTTAIERDKEAASGFRQLVSLYHMQKASKRGRGPQLGVVSEVIPGSSSASGVPAAEMAAAAAAAAAAPAVPAGQVLTDLKKHIDGVVRNIAILSDSYARDRTKTNATCFFFSGASGSRKVFFSPTHSRLPPATVDDAASFEYFCQNALLEMAAAMFSCDEPKDTGDAVRPRRDDHVYDADDLKEKKKNSGETKGGEAGTAETKGGEEEGDQMQEDGV